MISSASLIVRLERRLYLVVRVDEVEDVRVGLSGADAVDARERLHGLDVPQLLVDDHRVQKRFVEPRLKLLGNDEDAALGVEHDLGLRLLDRLAHRKRVEALFGALVCDSLTVLPIESALRLSSV